MHNIPPVRFKESVAALSSVQKSVMTNLCEEGLKPL